LFLVAFAAWNPAEDRQAVDRAYRIGQTKPVVVYRLIMASSVEEKMYEKQVFKDGVRVVTESGTSSRYFSKAETKELFTLGPADKSVVMERMWTAAGSELRSFPDTRGELPSVLGYSRHDTLYTEVRPDSQSQGQDAYTQFADASYVPSDSDDDEIGIPPTPAPRARVVPKPPQSSHKPRKFEPVSAVKLSGKENTSGNVGTQHVKSCFSDPFDLMTPPAAKSTSAGCEHSGGVDPVAYEQLQASKLYSPEKQSQPSAGGDRTARRIVCTPEETPTRRASVPNTGVKVQGDGAAKADLFGAALSDRSPAGSLGGWDAAVVAAYNSLRSSKLHTPSEVDGASPPLPAFASPTATGRFSLPDRVSMLTEPSMYGDECEVGDTSYVVFPEPYCSGDSSTGPEVGHQISLLEDALLIGELADASEEPEELDDSERGEHCAASPTEASTVVEPVVGANDGSVSNTQRGCQDEETTPSTVDPYGVVDVKPARRQTMVLTDDYTNGGTEDDGASVTAGDGHSCGAADGGVDAFSVASAKVLLEPEGWSDDDSDVGGELQACDHEEHSVAPESPVYVSKEEPQSLEASPVTSEVPQPTRTSPEHRRGTLCSGAEGTVYGSDNDDESGCFSDFPTSAQGPPVGAVSRGGFLLNNLCEMGSMKRTVSVTGAGSGVATQEDSTSAAPTMEASSPAETSPQIGCSQKVSQLTSLSGDAPAPGTPLDSVEQRERTGGITVRKGRQRLSNYMEPDLFASPPWMAPSLFSPDAHPPSAVPRFSEGDTTNMYASAPATPIISTPQIGPVGSVGNSEERGHFECKSKSVDEELSELYAQVNSLSLEAAAPATPLSKISFQAAAGAFSNMVVKVQSVAKAPRAFAALSDSDESDADEDDGASDGDSGSEDGAHCGSTADSAEPATPELCATASTAASGSTRGFTGSQSQGSASRRSTSSGSKVSPCKELFGEEYHDLSEPATVVSSVRSAPQSVSSKNTHSGVPSTFFEECTVGTLPEDNTAFTRSLGTLRLQLDQPSLHFPVDKPLRYLDSHARHEYDALIAQGKRCEQRRQLEDAARSYCAALELCDEDPVLHGKLSWLHSCLRTAEGLI
jgi:hypothetical protein